MIMNEEQQAKILLNNEVKVTDHRTQLVGQTGIVEAIMADGRTLDVKLSNGKNAFLMSPLWVRSKSGHSSPRPSKALAQSQTTWCKTAFRVDQPPINY